MNPARAITFGVSTWLWTSPFKTETVALFPKIKAMGFDFVEIPVEDVALINGPLVRRALADHGLAPVVCGAFGPTRDLTADDPKLRANGLDYITRSLDLAGEVGGKFLAGPMYSAVGKARLVPPEQRRLEWQRAVENVRHAAELAGARGLQLAIEPLNRFESDLVNTAEDVVRLVDEIAHPAARVMLDSFHMTIEERDLEQAIRTVGPRLLHVQVSENFRGTPGTGQTRWDSFKRGLDAVGYTGGVSIECFTPEIKELAGAVCFWRPMAASQDAFAADGLAFLRRLLAQ
jgi:D-psicose/D-tagatose/L-ribulose 3-epimerase